MKAKLFAIALIAAVAYASISVSRAYGEELVVPEDVQLCMELKYNVNTAIKAIEDFEAAGGKVPSELIAEILIAARIYTDICIDYTGPLLMGVSDD